MAILKPDDFEERLLVTVSGNKEEEDPMEMGNPFHAMMTQNRDFLKGVVMRIEAINLPYISLSAWDNRDRHVCPIMIDSREKSLMKISEDFANVACRVPDIHEVFDESLREDMLK